MSQKKISPLRPLGPGPPQAAQQQRTKHQPMKRATSGNANPRLLQSQSRVRIMQDLQPGEQYEQLDIRRALEEAAERRSAGEASKQEPANTKPRLLQSQSRARVMQDLQPGEQHEQLDIRRALEEAAERLSAAEAPKQKPASASCSEPALQHTKPGRETPPQTHSMSAIQQAPTSQGSKISYALTAEAGYPQIHFSAQTHRMETELQQLAKMTAAMPWTQNGVALAAPAVTANTSATTATGPPSILVRSSVLRQSRSKASDSPMGSDCEYLREWSPSNFLKDPSTSLSPSPRSKVATASKECPHEIGLQPEAQQATPEDLQQWFAYTLEAYKQDPNPGN